jgi:hypothetical protein
MFNFSVTTFCDYCCFSLLIITLVLYGNLVKQFTIPAQLIFKKLLRLHHPPKVSAAISIDYISDYSRVCSVKGHSTFDLITYD